MVADALNLRISLDREQVARPGGLRLFVERAWGRIEPNPFRGNWHVDAICDHLEALFLGQISKLLINQPPGTSKSLIASTLFPAWVWAKRPTERIIASTYAQDLSDKNARLHRDLVLSDWYTARWPLARITGDSATKVREFANVSQGWRFTTSVGGIVTGQHGDILLGDDLVKAQDAEGRALVDPKAIQAANDFWFKVMPTRRRDSGTTRMVLIMQRLHHEDAAEKAKEAGYHALVLPMAYDPRKKCSTAILWHNPLTKRREPFEDPRTEKGELLDPGRWPADVVEELRKSLGPFTAAAQLDQDPTPVKGGIFKRVGDFRWKDAPKDGRRIITLDCAFKDKSTSDFVCLQHWIHSGRFFYLVDEDMDRMSFSETLRRTLRFMDRHEGCGVYVEDKANGPAVIESLKGEVPGILDWTPTGSKEARAHAVSHLFEAGDVLLPPDSLAPWIADYVKDLNKFPLILHDDRIDATTMALLILYRPRASRYEEMIVAMKKGLVRR